MLIAILLITILILSHAFQHSLPGKTVLLNCGTQKYGKLTGKHYMTLPNRTPEEVFSNLFRMVDESQLRGVLTYPDLSKYANGNLVGILFLATNFVYTWAGYVAFHRGQTGFALIVEAASLASYYYHWTQLEFGPNNVKVVQALLLDYFVAIITITTFLNTLYEASQFSPGHAGVSFELALAGLVCLILSWINHFGFPYIVFHGLWHILSGSATASLPLPIV